MLFEILATGISFVSGVAVSYYFRGNKQKNKQKEEVLDPIVEQIILMIDQVKNNTKEGHAESWAIYEMGFTLNRASVNHFVYDPMIYEWDSQNKKPFRVIHFLTPFEIKKLKEAIKQRDLMCLLDQSLEKDRLLQDVNDEIKVDDSSLLKKPKSTKTNNNKKKGK